MSTYKLTNIPLSEYRVFLKAAGCKCIRTNGGHETWSRSDLLRPIIIQSHIDPVPEFIIRNGLRSLGMNKKDFFKILYDL